MKSTSKKAQFNVNSFNDNNKEALEFSRISNDFDTSENISSKLMNSE